MEISQHILVTVDILLFTILDNKLKILLIKRNIPPFEGMWAVPGGFVKDNESLDKAALRELQEETGVKDIFIEHVLPKPSFLVVLFLPLHLLRTQNQCIDLRVS